MYIPFRSTSKWPHEICTVYFLTPLSITRRNEIPCECDQRLQQCAYPTTLAQYSNSVVLVPPPQLTFDVIYSKGQHNYILFLLLEHMYEHVDYFNYSDQLLKYVVRYNWERIAYLHLNQ